MEQLHPPSQVIKIPEFRGRLSTRPLYIYLPAGYDEQLDVQYPVIYMHDGQNCFQKYVADSFAGSWRADEIADSLIREGKMQPCIIVGVSHGEEQRSAEYMPSYATLQPRLGRFPIPWPNPTHGRAEETFAYYSEDVDLFLRQNYRLLEGRDFVATCGSSMGGLFSTYIAWEHPEFARHHAIMSPAFWVTSNWRGVPAAIERMGNGRPPDVRIWLDSGMQNTPGHGDDDWKYTRKARDVLLSNGFIPGEDFQYYRDEGGIHSESSWARRLPLAFQFLYPVRQPEPEGVQEPDYEEK